MRAIFIGGAFDMATRELNVEHNEIRFYEPVEMVPELHPKELIPCRKLIYELITKTRKGVLIYEFVGGKP